MEPRTGPHDAARRRWADIVVIVASVYSLLAAAWAPPEALSGNDAREVADTGWLLIAYALGGTLGILGLILAQRHPFAGRLLIGAGGIAVLSGFLALRTITLLAALSLGLTGFALLSAAPLAGPMPRPEDEGESA